MKRTAAFLRALIPLKGRSRVLAMYYTALTVWLLTTAMHIPDGYLSPATCAVMFLIVLPFWYFGLRKLREKMNARSAPVIALVAAFTFVIMMFNVPLPGGTTGHAVGGALAAIVLGPEVATLAISVALMIQALVFGDGGILAIGANCFNMAVVLPFIAYAVYRWVGGKSPVKSGRWVAGSALAGWIGLTVAAFFAAIEFGVQPMLFHTANGTPLYAPYPLSVALPAMVIPHLLIASPIEGLLTALVAVYLQRSNPAMLEAGRDANLTSETGRFATLRGLWVALAVLVVATPLGLLAPGTAWGEWSGQELSAVGLGFVPQGLAKLAGLWGAPLPKYDLPALGNAPLGYVLSAVLGVVVVGMLAWLVVTLLTSSSRSGTKG